MFYNSFSAAFDFMSVLSPIETKHFMLFCCDCMFNTINFVHSVLSGTVIGFQENVVVIGHMCFEIFVKEEATSFCNTFQSTGPADHRCAQRANVFVFCLCLAVHLEWHRVGGEGFRGHHRMSSFYSPHCLLH